MRFFGVSMIFLGACIPLEEEVINQGSDLDHEDDKLSQVQDQVIVMEGDMIKFQLSSPAFEHKGRIPQKYTCKGEDVSPPLEWKDSPSGVISYALIMDDPDAPVGTWVHWVIYNIPGTTTSLSEGIEGGTKVANGSLQGKSSWGRSQYNGPCPPVGEHRYFFKLYALDVNLNLDGDVTKADLIHAIQGHTLGYAELMGVFSK